MVQSLFVFSQENFTTKENCFINFYNNKLGLGLMDILPKEGFIKIRGYRLHYLQWGEKGFPLIILHSMAMDAHAYDFLSKVLSVEYQILAFDLLDHGDSEKLNGPIGFEEHAEIVWQAIKKLGFSPTVLIEHSLGGILGMILTAKYPDEFKGLVLVDIAPFDLTDKRYAPPRRPPKSFASENEARKFLLETFPKFTKESIENRMKYAFVKCPDGSLCFRGIGEALRPPDVDLWPFVERIRLPTLLLIGGDSGIVSLCVCERMSSFIHDFKAITVKGATHMLPQDKPLEFEREVWSFLASLHT